MTVRTLKIGVGRNNTVAGERHHNAKLTDHEVDLILELLDGGMKPALIADKFEISVRTVYMYASSERRTYAGYRIITITDKK